MNVAQQLRYIQQLESRLETPRACSSDEKNKIRKVVVTLSNKVDAFCDARAANVADKTKARRRQLQGREPQYRIGRPPTCR